MTSPARLKVVPAAFTDGSPVGKDEQNIADAILDAHLATLEEAAGSTRWPEHLAATTGQQLTVRQSEMEDKHRRARVEMRQEARDQAFRLARWVDVMMRHYGQWWYDQAVRLNMTSLERQTLYNIHGLLRVPEELRDTDVWPAVMLAANAAGSPEGVENLLAFAAATEAKAKPVGKLAQVMAANRLIEVPVLAATGGDDDMPDAPDPVSDWWARYTNTVTALCDFMTERRIQEVDVLRWRRELHVLGQERIR